MLTKCFAVDQKKAFNQMIAAPLKRPNKYAIWNLDLPCPRQSVAILLALEELGAGTEELREVVTTTITITDTMCQFQCLRKC